MAGGLRAAVSLRRAREFELSVEREILDTSGVSRRVRLTSHFLLPDGASAPTPAEYAEAIRELDRELEAARAQAGFRGPAPRVDRSRTELLETYRPRQAELVDALLADGEISEGEAEMLRSALPTPRAGPRSEAPTKPTLVPETDRPLAAMPLSNDRAPTVARPVTELLATFQIATLKQAGAIRARRQISYDEYMALKRHFGASDPIPGAPV